MTREGQGSVEVASRLTAPAQAVWDRVSTFDGVNDEPMPIMRMTAPRHMRSLAPEDVVLGQRLFRSWVLLFGVLPFDYDDLTLVALEPGRGFHERSTMGSFRTWEHERWSSRTATAPAAALRTAPLAAVSSNRPALYGVFG